MRFAMHMLQWDKNRCSRLHPNQSIPNASECIRNDAPWCVKSDAPICDLPCICYNGSTMVCQKCCTDMRFAMHMLQWENNRCSRLHPNQFIPNASECIRNDAPWYVKSDAPICEMPCICYNGTITGVRGFFPTNLFRMHQNASEVMHHGMSKVMHRNAICHAYVSMGQEQVFEAYSESIRMHQK